MDTQLENEQQAIEWVRQIIPFAIKPTKKAKTTFVSPFTSNNAYLVVTEEIGKACQNLNRNFVGFELNTEIANASSERLSL